MSELTGFPEDFMWGAATSAYQIEGSPLADGAGPSNWHQFSHERGRIAQGDTGDRGCDHYRHYRDDVAIMAQLGLRAYRFSISWSRILPEGRGHVNAKGLDFYRRLAECLSERGIQPFATLYHWDLPLALDSEGGWANRDSAHWFADYAQTVYRSLGGYISHWATLNEPWVVVDAGYIQGVHPPGISSPENAPHVAHNLLRAHALAVQAFRAEGLGKIGLVVNLEPKYAASSDPADVAAMTRSHAYMNRQFLDPVFLGAYPDEMAEIYGPAWPIFPESELRLIQEPIDFLGINYYSRSVVYNDPLGGICAASPLAQREAEHTAMGWEVFPEGLETALRWVKRRYGDIPLYVTENGAAYDDPATGRGVIEDPKRIAYLRSHLNAARDAMRAGVNLRGYFVWSLLDNFEWTYGYSKRFGIVHVDFANQRRSLKGSANFYARVISSQGAELDR
jgi:beta-glucosidase